jgi:DNA-binding response OmpR family regulator
MSTRRVLVLEDEPLISMMMRDWLAELGYETLGPAETVQAALALIESTQPDAAILDISLGNQDCYPVADRLQDQAVPFAFATGRSGDSIVIRHRSAPRLAKPFTFEAVGGVISKLLNSGTS